ncbi:MAG: sulfatase [Bryobacterales bacterium]|jgi:arylsulfatase A-like enzyme|nr:sulfatase [Bryobacterales bacterium]
MKSNCVATPLSRRGFLAAAAGLCGCARPIPRRNVLFLVVDDLRPQLGCYGDRTVKTPHIDALAARGVLFERAYAQQALCSPSRTSFLTGLRPDTTGIYDIETHFRDRVPDVVTLPQLFRNSGYSTRGFYKVFHMAGFDPNLGNLNDPPSWTEPLYLPVRSVYGPEGEGLLRRSYAQLEAEGKTLSYQHIPRSLAFEAPDVPDEALSDGEVAHEAVNALRAWKDRPFFMAVGFYKPHLPFVAPKRYWDLYREDEIPLPENQYPPQHAPSYAVPDDKELRSYVGIPKQGEFPDELKRKLMHAYLASISYVDAQIGKVLAALQALGLNENTVVVLLGDHGFQMGEHGTWAKKHSNFEIAANAPLIVAAPGSAQAGVKSKALVEFIDLYPTLAELCALPESGALEGTSFAPVLAHPHRPWKKAAFCQYPRGAVMGRSVTDGRFRYTQWARRNEAPDAAELYDHETDPGENVNRSGDPAFAGDEARMRSLLHGGWRAARPVGYGGER